MLECYSNNELFAIANKIYKRTRLDFGGSFDLPTFKSCFPRRASVYAAIDAELRRRSA